MIFKKGDKVYDAQFGWGEVEIANGDVDFGFNLRVSFKGLEKYYTSDGRLSINAEPTLSFTEYTLQGFSQERPLPFKVGDVVYFSDNKEAWVTTILTVIFKKSDNPFRAKDIGGYSQLALDNPLKNPDTKIYTKEDL